eukprot:3867033-Amphidinium_carterae.1
MFMPHIQRMRRFLIQSCCLRFGAICQRQLLGTSRLVAAQIVTIGNKRSLSTRESAIHVCVLSKAEAHFEAVAAALAELAATASADLATYWSNSVKLSALPGCPG